MSRRRKNPHPQRAVNAKTVLKATEKEEEPLVLRSRMIPDDEDEGTSRRQIVRYEKGGKKGRKIQNQQREV